MPLQDLQAGAVAPAMGSPRSLPVLSGLTGVGGPQMVGLWGTPEHTAVSTTTRMAKTWVRQVLRQSQGASCHLYREAHRSH